MGFKREKFELNSGVSGITELDGQGATWQADIWDFKVPNNTQIILSPSDTFAIYLVGDDAAEMPKQTKIRVVIRDVSNETAKPIIKDCNYQRFKSFADKKQIVRLEVPEEIVVDSEEHIVVMVNGADAAGTGDTDASASHFKLVTTRNRKVSW